MAKALCAPGTYLQGKGELGKLATRAAEVDGTMRALAWARRGRLS